MARPTAELFPSSFISFDEAWRRGLKPRFEMSDALPSLEIAYLETDAHAKLLFVEVFECCF